MKIYLSLITMMVITGMCHASLEIPPGQDVIKGCEEADYLFEHQDVEGLTTLLTNSNFVVEQRVAMHLAELGAKKTLPLLRKKDFAYERGTTVSLGEFSVAIALLENDSPDARREALLSLAKTGFSSRDDLDQWYTYTTNRLERYQWLDRKERYEKIFVDASECIDEGTVYSRRDYKRSEFAAEVLLEYANENVIQELIPLGDYGSEYTILAFNCKNKENEEAIAYCIDVLDKFETPPKASAAERVLRTYGAQALPSVRQLRKKHDIISDTQSKSHTIAWWCELMIKDTVADAS